MAMLTAGTSATTSLVSQIFSRAMATADIAQINNALKDEQNVAFPRFPGGFSQSGLLAIPNRGILQVLPGDYVCYDATTGWPILLSARTIAAGPWAHS